MICPYCNYERGHIHSCEKMETALQQIRETIKDIDLSMQNPGHRPLTSYGMKAKADYKRELAAQVKLQGGKVRPDYE